MMVKLPTTILRYGVALVAVALALLITVNVDILIERGSLALLFAAIIIATWYGGRGPGLLALVLSVIGGEYFIIAPRYSFDVSWDTALPFTTFIPLTLLLVLLLSAFQQREILLRASETRYRFLFENNPMPMWVFDRETLKFLAVNEAAISHYGYSREEFLSMTLLEIRPAEDHAALKEDVFRKEPGSKSVGTWRHIRNNGSLIDVEITAHELDFEGKPSRLVLASDITERKRAETLLRESEEHLQTVIENLAEGLVVADLDGEVSFFNRAALDMHGFATLDECRRHLDEFAEIFELSDLEGAILPLEQWPLARVLRGENLRNFEVHIRHLAGGWQKVFEYGGILIQPGEKDAMAIVTMSDITEKKRAAVQIKRLNAELEQRVVERTAELEAANKELEAFSYSVSHDLRAPLRHINGFSMALLEDYADKLDDTGKGYLQEVRGASQEMAQLIDDVLQLARVTRAEMRREKVDMTGLAEEILAGLRKRDPGRSVKTRVEKGLAAYGDRRLLDIVLTNLFENAWKFSAKRDDAEIVFGADRTNGNGFFFVRDNGAGFDMAYADKLYGAFQRLHSADEFEGTGIGLATVQRIINRHGGRVWAEGAVDKGATFHFILADQKEDENEG